MKQFAPTLLLASAAALLPVVSSTNNVFRSKPPSDDIGSPGICFLDLAGGTSVDGILPPCVEIAVIENTCLPNGTDPIDLEAHAQCMCKGSFFSDWRGCQTCLLYHGFRSERDNIYWDNVLSVASQDLCTGTPTADFQSLFASARSDTARVPLATVGDAASTDWFPGETAVSIYYTAARPQGPGSITGIAASTSTSQQITPTRDILAGPLTLNETRNGTVLTTGASTFRTPTQPTASDISNDAPTHHSGLAMAIAGAALVAAL